MSAAEWIRILCYTVTTPLLLYLALWALRERLYPQMLIYGSLSLNFVWYMIELSIASTGANTRELRIINTPMIIMLTVGAIWMATNIYRLRKYETNRKRG